jgi:SET domain-containing protein
MTVKNKSPWDELNESVWATIGVSKIHGVGVIAIRDIPRGTVICGKNTKHFKYPLEDFNKVLPEIQKIILDRMLFPRGMTSLEFYHPNIIPLQVFMNHSNTPNTDGFIALVDIKKGEELTEDYKSFYTEGIHLINLDNAPFLK